MELFITSVSQMNVKYYHTAGTEQAQLFKCCTLPQPNLTPP